MEKYRTEKSACAQPGSVLRALRTMVNTQAGMRVGLEWSRRRLVWRDQGLAASRVRSERVVAVKMGGREGCEKCFYSPA